MASVTSSSSTVDLSRLPAPTVVEQLSYETILDAMVARLRDLLPTFDASVDSDPAVKVLQVAAYRELLLRQDFNDRARQVMPAYSTGSNLDQLAALVGVSRLLVAAADSLTGAPAVYEGDEALRRRIILAPESFSVAGPESAYVFHALSSDATILDATATSPTPGQVRITLLSAIGSGAASADQIAAVQAVVASKPIRPLTDEVVVASATIVPFTVLARLILFSGPDETVIVAAAQRRVTAYLSQARLLGRDVTRSALFAALHAEGVQNVELIEPAADVIVDRTQATWCVGSNVTVGGYGD